MNFNKNAKSIVEPTLLFFGFTIKKEIKGIIEYDHKYLTATMSYDYNSSCEVDFTILFKASNLFYGYNELMGHFYNKKANLSAIQITDENTLIEWLKEVNRFLKDNLNNIINNRTKIQIELERIRLRQINTYEAEKNNRLLREGVEKYWSAKDYPGLVKFLKSYKGEIGETIKGKYEYALKMIAKK